MARGSQLIVKLEDSIRKEFQEYCAELGIPMSTMAAMMIGQAMRASRVQEKAIQEMAETVMMKMAATVQAAQAEGSRQGRDAEQAG